MKAIIILILSFFALTSYSQDKYNDNDIIGNYTYEKQEVKGAIAYFTITIELMKNKTFVYSSGSHILGGSSERKGTWEIDKNILVLINEDKTTNKYLITEKGLYKTPKTRKSICLKKSNQQTLE